MTTRREQEAMWAEVYGRLTPDQRRIADDISKRAQDKANQQLLWAEELVAIADDLAASRPGAAPWLAVRMLWVRLHGVVTELVEIHRATADLAKTMTEREVGRSLVKFGVTIFDAAKAVLAALDEPEVVVADYLRQRAVHLRQDSYVIRSTNRGVRDTRRIEHLGKDFTVEKVDRMRTELFRLHGGEAEFARHMAAKIRPAAARLLDALRALHELPPM